MGSEGTKSGYMLQRWIPSQPETRDRRRGDGLYFSIRAVCHSYIDPSVARLPLIEGVTPNARLLQPTDGRSGPELTIRKLAFPAPVDLASISMSANAFDDAPVCMAFHPQVARLAVAERKKIVIRTARSER